MTKVSLTTSTSDATFLDDTCNPSYEEADVILLGIACDLTASYNKGAWYGPYALLDASYQIEYPVPGFGISLTEKVKIHNYGILICPKSVDSNGEVIEYSKKEINISMQEMVKKTEKIALNVFENNKLLMLFGGDHSVPNGVWKAIKKRYNPEEVTILHFDGHLDLRDTLDDLKYSHACIMRRARDTGFRVLQVGIRDHISEEESVYIQEKNLKDDIYFCATQTLGFYEEFKMTLSKKNSIQHSNLIFNGELTQTQIQSLNKKISQAKYLWISIDVDGLDASDIPGTGTPLPLGLKRKAIRETIYSALRTAAKYKIKVLGFDINEVSPQLKKEGDYTAMNTVSTINEMDAALLAYNILFWNYLERFTK